MSQFGTSSFGSPKKDNHYEKYAQITLEETYYMVCIKKCIKDYSTPLSGNEKVCLAKCLDRSYDYLRLLEKQANPLNENYQKKYVIKTDGVNLLGFKTQQSAGFI